MNIYEYDQVLESLIDPETGEVFDYDAFLELSMERDSKIENTAVYVKNLISQTEAIKAEERALKARREPMERRAKRLKEYLANYLNGERFECPRASLSFRKSTALEVLDATAAAEWLEDHGHTDTVTWSAPTLDKRAVTAIIKAGDPVPGVELVAHNSLQVR